MTPRLPKTDPGVIPRDRGGLVDLRTAQYRLKIPLVPLPGFIGYSAAGHPPPFYRPIKSAHKVRKNGLTLRMICMGGLDRGGGLLYKLIYRQIPTCLGISFITPPSTKRVNGYMIEVGESPVESCKT